MTKIARREAKVPTADIEVLLTEFGEHKTMAEKLDERIGVVKKRLMGILERSGKPDDKGSLWIEFDEPVAGYEAIKREKRSKIFLVPDKAEEILRERELYDQCIEVDVTFEADQLDAVFAALKAAGIYDQVVTTTERLAEDKIMQVFFAEKENEEPKLTTADLEKMFREEITWAFVPKKAP